MNTNVTALTLNKACVTFNLEQGPTAASDLLANLKAAFETGGIIVEGPFSNSLGYATVSCNIPERVDLIAFRGDGMDPWSWMLRIVAATPWYKRIFSRSPSKGNLGECAHRVLSSAIEGFLGTVGAYDVRWLTDEEAASQELVRRSRQRHA